MSDHQYNPHTRRQKCRRRPFTRLTALLLGLAAGVGPALGANAANASPPNTAWIVGITASANELWPDQYTTITATANADVGPTPYDLRIYDETSGSYVADCAVGASCTVSVTQPTASSHTYLGIIAPAATGFPAAGEQARSAPLRVVWRSVSITLTASPTTVPVGGTSTLKATASADIKPSPFAIQIFDTTDGTRLASCDFGASCSVTVTRSTATTHAYTAFVANYRAAYPPPQIQATSATSYLTWSASGWRVHLSAPLTTYGTSTVTATANRDVRATPYWLEIFDEKGSLLTSCQSGPSCSVTFTPPYRKINLVAFVSSYGVKLPPPGILASSNVTATRRKTGP